MSTITINNTLNHNDNWHKYMSNEFNVDCKTEVSYKNIKRRADVVLNDNYTIEIQHSFIKKEEVDNRKLDWESVGKNIIWLIDGNDINIEKLENSNRIFFEFRSEWKFKHFTSYDTIYIYIDHYIYKLNPNLVKSNMIDVQQPLSFQEFKHKLIHNETLFSEEDVIQTQFYIKQQGAGNGKTYGIVQLLKNNDFKHYETFVYLTKQHSAVYVIKSEIEDQIKRGELDGIEKLDYEVRSNKHIYNFLDKYNKNKKKIIIGTFDSFVFALGDKDKRGVDKFIKMAKGIIDEELKCDKYGNVKYADGIKLNKRLLLVGDEMQDLSEEYIKAIIKISRDRYVNFYGVGDLLQSISIKNNSFTFLYYNELPMIKKIQYDNVNVCRRFQNKKLINFVNTLIPFDKYKLPTIRSFNEYNDDNSLNIFNGKVVYQHDSIDKIEEEIQDIMFHYDKEVQENNYKPNDFLIITPFTKKNILLDSLNTEIRNYWINKYENMNYTKYAVFHKSEDGVSIDLSESENATRIVSIHSSKGDGRPVVFVIGLTEQNLKKFSVETDNLIYDSLLHVALTRMKKKLYFRLEANNDNIYKRVLKYLQNYDDIQNIKPFLNINKNLKIENLKQNIQKQNENFTTIYDKIIKFTKYKETVLFDKERNIIDMQHHCVRYIIFYVLWIFQIMKDNIMKDNIVEDKVNHDVYQQIYQILKKLCNKRIDYETCTKKYHQKLNDCKYLKNNIVIFEYSKINSDYLKYSQFLKERINCIINNIQNFIQNKKIFEINIIDTFIIFHLMQISDQGIYSGLSISDLYDLIYLYKKEENTNSLDKYTQSHYNKIDIIEKLHKELKKQFPDIKYLTDHFVYLNGKKHPTTIEIFKKFQMIGYNNNTVLIFYIKPQFNSLNYNDIMLESILDTFLIQNVKKYKKENIESENYKKFNGKKILTCVLTLDLDKPFLFDWSSNENLIEKNNELLKNILQNDVEEYFKLNLDNIYSYFKYYYNKYKNISSKKIIHKIKEEYNMLKEENKHPAYIYEFLENMDRQILNLKKNERIQFLNNLNNKNIFKDKINLFLYKEIDTYFNGENDLDSDSDDE